MIVMSIETIFSLNYASTEYGFLLPPSGER